MNRHVRHVIAIAVALHALSSSVGAVPERLRSYVWLGEVVLYDRDDVAGKPLAALEEA